MNNKLLFGALGALFLGVGLFTVTSLSAKENVSSLTLANIEALTQSEIGGWASNWKDTTFVCTRTETSGSGIDGFFWNETSVTYTFTYNGCGYGAGWCWSSAGCPN